MCLLADGMENDGVLVYYLCCPVYTYPEHEIRKLPGRYLSTDYQYCNLLIRFEWRTVTDNALKVYDAPFLSNVPPIITRNCIMTADA